MEREVLGRRGRRYHQLAAENESWEERKGAERKRYYLKKGYDMGATDRDRRLINSQKMKARKVWKENQSKWASILDIIG